MLAKREFRRTILIHAECDTRSFNTSDFPEDRDLLLHQAVPQLSCFVVFHVMPIALAAEFQVFIPQLLCVLD